MSVEPFSLRLSPTPATPVVFASPHSGRHYPEEFLARTVLDAHAVRSSEDAFMDDLIVCAPALGAHSILAHVPRAYVDLNRAPDELDPAVISGLGRVPMTPRLSSGLGVIPRVVANGRAIYRGKITLDEARARLDRWYHPYHAALTELLGAVRMEFGQAVLIDCHSMPHEALDNLRAAGGKRPDVVLGDRFGAAADPDVVAHVEAAFAAAGLTVARNAPFAGAFVAQRYGRPAQGTNVVQIEIDRALYMDEARIRPHAGYAAFKAMFAGILAEIAQYGRRTPVALAAE
jgi:N-formylglutamate deformylase